MLPYFPPAFQGERGNGNESASFEDQDLLGAMFGAGPALQIAAQSQGHLGTIAKPSQRAHPPAQNGDWGAFLWL